MSCSIINKKLKRLPENLSESSIVDIIIDQENSGYYFDTNEISKIITRRLGGEYPIQSFINFFENSINNNKVFSKHEFFSKELQELYKNVPNQLEYMKNSFKRELVKIAFIDVNAEQKITLNDSHLNEKVQNYKNKLLKNIYDYIISITPSYPLEYRELYKNGRYQSNNSYNQLLNDLAVLMNGVDLDLSTKDVESLKILNSYNSAVILSNFDSLINDNFRSIVSVNQKNYGALTNPVDNFHYFAEFKGSYTEY